jgi:hypothetical protein
MKPKDYTNHSGGAKGADMKWDEIGRRYGVIDHVHWRPRDLEQLSGAALLKMKIDFDFAAKALKRPSEFKGVELAQRNWLQVRYGDAVYAIAHIVPLGGVCYQGFTNDTGREIVAGGTGWAVEMAIQKGKPVYVFDMSRDKWYVWNDGPDGDAAHFYPSEVPTLTKNFAGIGSRILTPEGVQAIEDVYIKTFNNVQSTESNKSKEKENNPTP